jgi:hypothetical protein
MGAATLVRSGLVLVVVVLAGLAARSANVGGAEPALAPSGPAPAPAPVLVGIRPKTITASPAPRPIEVVGRHLTAGTTARVISPLEAVTSTFPAAALEALTPTSFTLRATFDDPGIHQLSVRSADGRRSNSVTIRVTPPAPAPARRR